MNIHLNEILNLSQKEINNSKIELNMNHGTGGMPVLDKWLSCEEKDKENGTTDCCYWGWRGSKRAYQVGQFVFSFARMTNDEWLFLSAAKVTQMPDHIPSTGRAVVEPLKKYISLFGRLIIKYKKGNTYGTFRFNLSNKIESCTVKEILPAIYNGEKFEGYDCVHLPYRKLNDIFTGKTMPTYYEALEKITGIYCLTDTNNGKLYIGSAYGEGGVAKRWGSYLSTKHGGNVKLKELYDTKGTAYFERYFTFTLLEYFGMSYDPGKIIIREQYWKRCFDTIKNGYNDN